MTLKDTNELFDVLEKLPSRLQRLTNVSPLVINPKAKVLSSEWWRKIKVQKVRLKNNREKSAGHDRPIKNKEVLNIKTRVIKNKGRARLLIWFYSLTINLWSN